MKIDKKSLYEILVKYDSNELFKDFCDSLSKIIQGKYTDDDTIKIISFATTIDKEDVYSIDQNVGIYEVIF